MRSRLRGAHTNMSLSATSNGHERRNKKLAFHLLPPPPPVFKFVYSRGGNSAGTVTLAPFTQHKRTAVTSKWFSSTAHKKGHRHVHTIPSFSSLSKMVRYSALSASLVVLASSSCTAFVAPLAPARVSTTPSMSMKGPGGRSSSPINKATGIISKVGQSSADRCGSSASMKATSRTAHTSTVTAPFFCTRSKQSICSS